MILSSIISSDKEQLTDKLQSKIKCFKELELQGISTISSKMITSQVLHLSHMKLENIALCLLIIIKNSCLYDLEYFYPIMHKTFQSNINISKLN